MVKKILSFLDLKNGFVWFISLYICISFWGMNHTPLFDEDEGFFAEASRQMLSKNSFIVIEVNGQERYDKPALYFWVTAFSLKMFGINEFAARLPSFVFFLSTLLLLYRFVLKYFTKFQAELAVVISISILQFQVLGRAAVSDNLLNLLVSGAMFSFYSYLQKPRLKTLFLIYTFAGLGFFTKGPIAFVIPASVIFLFLVYTKNWIIMKKMLNPFFIFWAFLIPLPWFVMAYQKSGDFLFSDFIIKHNFGRFSETMESHGGHFLYYLPVLFLSFLPFTHLIFSAFKSFKFSDRNFFLLLWFVVPFVLFSFSKTQLPHYISIGYLPLIVLIINSKKIGVVSVYFQVIILLLLFFIAPILIKKIEINDVFVVKMIDDSSCIFDRFYFYFIFFLLILVILFFKLYKSTIYPIIILYCVSTTFFMFKFGILQQGFVKETGLNFRDSNEIINMKDHYNPSLSFYARKAFPIKTQFYKGDLIFSKFKNISSDSTIKQKNGFVLSKKN